MEWLLEKTKTESSFIFSELFPNGVALRTLVATFLALLELTRLKRFRIAQNEAFTDIICTAVPEELPAPVPAPVAEIPLETAAIPDTLPS